MTIPKSIRAYLSKLGKAKSPAKTKAARENGKKGGRPRKATHGTEPTE